MRLGAGKWERWTLVADSNFSAIRRLQVAEFSRPKVLGPPPIHGS